MSKATDHTKHLPAHEATYGNFIRGAVALCIYCGFVLVALCSFAFGVTLQNFVGFGGLFVGLIAVLIDTTSELRWLPRWFLSGGLLIAFGLLTGINVS